MDNQISQHPPLFDVAIIGAGLAGSLCAHLLSETGLSVCVIDKSRGSGGRASSKRINDEVSCDLGATYVKTTHPEILSLFKSLEAKNIAARWDLVSTDQTPTFVGTPKMSSIARHWLGDTHFMTNTKVHHLDQVNLTTPDNADSVAWQIRNDKYQTVAIAKKIVLTAPAPQTAAILSTHSTLSEPLQITNQACAGYQSQWAMWLETAPSQQSAFITPVDSPLKKLLKDSDKPMRHKESVERWVLQATPEWSKHFLDQDKATTADALVQAFQAITALPVLRHGEPHRWFLSRFTGHKNATAGVWYPAQNLGLAGDWLCQGNAEGALLSALSVIEQMQLNHTTT
ncbi:NAD(P)/FAD-dependent oxidoreductase [Marinomonas algarum]|uniref:FAD-dependent oxidoreductase n=1 Tax=Marinomonas algarum TaxID=2883105 RepID=A0A9X1IKF8_9GAMM|nr:FAD-dependent oxidoreductase [Marinomonas algarum]MCB5160897.1 FAD-dependent oxidoreductase [Marinomonas algarum]